MGEKKFQDFQSPWKHTFQFEGCLRVWRTCAHPGGVKSRPSEWEQYLVLLVCGWKFLFRKQPSSSMCSIFSAKDLLLAPNEQGHSPSIKACRRKATRRKCVPPSQIWHKSASFVPQIRIINGKERQGSYIKATFLQFRSSTPNWAALE